MQALQHGGWKRVGQNAERIGRGLKPHFGPIDRSAVAVAGYFGLCRRMNENPTHPYALEIQPGSKAGTFQWIIRRSGKLIQRSDRSFPSEDAARNDGAKAIERQFADAQSTR